MQWNSVLVSAALAAAIVMVVFAAGGGLLAWQWRDAALARIDGSVETAWSGRWGGRHGRSVGGTKEPRHAGFCAREHDDVLVLLSAYVPHRLDLDASQRAAWSGVEEALSEGLDALRGTVCGTGGKAAGNPADVLAHLGAAMEDGAPRVNALSAAVARFRAMLDESQKGLFDGMFARHSENRRGRA